MLALIILVIIAVVLYTTKDERRIMKSIDRKIEDHSRKIKEYYKK